MIGICDRNFNHKNTIKKKYLQKSFTISHTYMINFALTIRHGNKKKNCKFIVDFLISIYLLYMFLSYRINIALFSCSL